jgi:hypothetical protein
MENSVLKHLPLALVVALAAAPAFADQATKPADPPPAAAAAHQHQHGAPPAAGAAAPLAHGSEGGQPCMRHEGAGHAGHGGPGPAAHAHGPGGADHAAHMQKMHDDCAAQMKAAPAAK